MRLLVLLVLLVGAPLRGASALITFEAGSPAGFLPSVGLEISNQFAVSDGVAFSFSDGSLPRLGDVNAPQGPGTTTEGWKYPNGVTPGTFDVLAPQETIAIGDWFLAPAAQGFLAGGSLVIDYLLPSQAASGDIIDVDATSVVDEWTVEAFDAGGMLLDTVILDPSSGGDGRVSEFGFSFSQPVIAQIQIRYTGTSPDPGFAFDNFDATSVPEPHAAALLAVGLLALARSRRRARPRN